MHVHVLYITVRTREINVLHRAHGMTLILRITAAPDTMMVNGNDFARFNIPDELGADGTERTSLAAYHIPVSQLSQRKRTQSMLVPTGIDTVLRHDKKCKRSLDHIEGLLYGKYARTLTLPRVFSYQVRQNLAVR